MNCEGPRKNLHLIRIEKDGKPCVLVVEDSVYERITKAIDKARLEAYEKASCDIIEMKILPESK